MTKKILLGLMWAIGAMMPALAQNVYVCKGFNNTKYQIASLEDITFDATKMTISIAGEEQDIADIDSITFEEPQFEKVRIVYNGSTATVTIPASFTGVTCTSGNSSHVVINCTNTTREYPYYLEGSSSNGSLTINGDYKLAVILGGVSLTSGKGAAIDVECGKRIDFILAEGTTNTLSDYAGGDQKAALYTKGHAEFKGAGILNVTGKVKHAIAAKEYIELKGSLGTINILGAVSDGIHCGKGEKGNTEDNIFRMNGGMVNISNCGSDCIDSDDYGNVKIKGGNLTLNVSQAEGTGIKCDSLFTMSNGNISIAVSGAISEGIRCSYRATFNGGSINGTATGNGSRGIRGKKTTKTTDTTLNGGFLDFNGTNITLDVSGGTYTADQSKCYGIKADQTLTQTAGDITVNVSNSAATAIKAGTDKWTGGTRNGATK
jgi:hypothetical protein